MMSKLEARPFQIGQNLLYVHALYEEVNAQIYVNFCRKLFSVGDGFASDLF
jgi:hypothetical protein